jgi:hypothetical protein
MCKNHGNAFQRLLPCQVSLNCDYVSCDSLRLSDFAVLNIYLITLRVRIFFWTICCKKYYVRKLSIAEKNPAFSVFLRLRER